MDTHSPKEKFLTLENLSPAVKNVRYAVRGQIVIRANELQKELELEQKGQHKNFNQIIRANIGDCHATGQKPMTFIRQMMALCAYPELLSDDRFPSDVKSRVERILSCCKGGSVGAYTDSAGLSVVKQDISEYITRRDGGVPCNPSDIYLTTGASGGIKRMMSLLLNGEGKKPAGFMIPIPQYPLYSATISEFNAEKIGYYLDEEDNWSLKVNELERAYQDSLERCEPKAICLINPGNPTGQVLSLENIQEIIRWAYEKKLFILADEVYQDNVYMNGLKFHSMKKTAYEMGSPYREMEIVSFYSTSKGFMGECGARGGYYEVINRLKYIVLKALNIPKRSKGYIGYHLIPFVVNMDSEVKVEHDKLASANLCSSVLGQVCMDAVVNPPRPGEPSHELFMKEKNNVIEGLKEKARLVTEILNKIEGVQCNPVQGAMYAFPKITLPSNSIQYAKEKNVQPDMYYCMELLESTGICVVPGSGFLQKDGTYHFRTTILPPPEQIKSLLHKFEEFHLSFLKKWTA